MLNMTVMSTPTYLFTIVRFKLILDGDIQYRLLLQEALDVVLTGNLRT